MHWCDTCQDFSYGARHDHFPQWEVQIYDTCGFPVYEEWVTHRARNAERAATKAAEEYDQEDYPLIRNSGNSIRVLVRPLAGGNAVAFKVHAEAVPTYYASEEAPEDALAAVDL